MACPECGGALIGFDVPPACQEFAPDGVETTAICSSCLVLTESPAEGGEFSALLEGFPRGDHGAAMALAVGLLVDSVTLHHDAIFALFDRVAAGGVDPWLVLERLAVSPTIDPDVDLERARTQLEQLTQ